MKSINLLFLFSTILLLSFFACTGTKDLSQNSDTVQNTKNEVQETQSTVEPVPDKPLIKETSTKIEPVPAVNETVTEPIKVKPEHTSVITTPDKYKTVTEQILTVPEHNRWETKNVDGTDVRVLVKVPAQYETITKKQLVQNSGYSTGGSAGPAGANGATGAAGVIGDTKARSSSGHAGATGAAGAQGPAGPAGATEAAGAQGPAGAAGAQGPAGPAASENTINQASQTSQNRVQAAALMGKGDPADANIISWVKVPAEYKTITKKVLKTPATTSTIEIPAQYETINGQLVETKPASTKIVEVPATFETVTERIQTAPESGRWETKNVFGSGHSSSGAYAPYAPPPPANPLIENEFFLPTENPLSTFSIDVDAASYSNIRSNLNRGRKPHYDQVRIEEMINYFNYDYPQPNKKQPFATHTEFGECPWNKDNYLLHIGLQGEEIKTKKLPKSNLVFLLDVSGSMNRPNKLGLVKESMELLLDNMPANNQVSIVVYASATGLVLPPTPFSEKETIKTAINNLKAGGSTAGGAGIQLAYQTAKDNFIKNGNNRVILCTDGDFNVGVSSKEGLKTLIEEKREEGIFLTVLGFGTGNYQDAKMEELSNYGNGNYGYIDNIKEAQKMLVEEMGATLHTIAKDVKLQIEFNPAVVQSYRLIGYENRMLKKEDFNDDTKDAGELGAGHTVTALYEIVPVASAQSVASTVDPLKYQSKQLTKTAIHSGEWVTIKLRYKPPTKDKSILLKHVVTGQDLYVVSNNFRFSAAVAYFGMMLRQSQFITEDFSYQKTIDLAKSGKGLDSEGYRSECIELMEKASQLN